MKILRISRRTFKSVTKRSRLTRTSLSTLTNTRISHLVLRFISRSAPYYKFEMSRKSLHSTNSDGSSSPLGYWDSKRSPKYSSSLSDNLNVDRRLSSLVPFSFPGLPSGTNVTPNLRDRSNLGQNTTASLNIPKLTHHDSIISTFVF